MGLFKEFPTQKDTGSQDIVGTIRTGKMDARSKTPYSLEAFRFTADHPDITAKLAELYEAEADKKRLLDMFLATFDELGTEVIFYHNMSDGDNIILWNSNYSKDGNAIIIFTDIPSGRFIIGLDEHGVPIALTADELTEYMG